jgi:hypothetical protein
MAEFSHHMIPFTGRGTIAQLTWAQSQMWREIQLMSSNPAFGNQTQGVAVPDGVTIDDVIEQLGVLTSRYESLRTVFYEDDHGLLVQEVVPAGELAVQLVLASGQEPDLPGIVLQQEQALLRSPFDHGADLPFRAVIGVLAGIPRLVLLSQSHLAVDFLSGRILVRELAALLGARVAGHPVPAAPPARQPADQAEFECSEQGRRLASRSLRHWRAELALASASMFPGPPARPAVPRYWRGAIRSRAVPPAVALLAARHKVSTSVILLAAMSLLLGRAAGRERCLTRIVAGNRITRELHQAVGNFTQEVPAAIDVSGGSFEAAVRSTWSAMMRAFRHAQYPPDQADTLIASLARERGADIDLSVCFNDLWSPVHGQAPAVTTDTDKIGHAASDTVYAWEDRIERAGVSFFLEVTDVPGDPDLARLSLLADTGRVPRPAIESFLFAMEELLIRLARGETGSGIDVTL